jgi:hypothetical protein
MYHVANVNISIQFYQFLFYVAFRTRVLAAVNQTWRLLSNTRAPVSPMMQIFIDGNYNYFRNILSFFIL